MDGEKKSKIVVILYPRPNPKEPTLFRLSREQIALEVARAMFRAISLFGDIIEDPNDIGQKYLRINISEEIPDKRMPKEVDPNEGLVKSLPERYVSGKEEDLVVIRMMNSDSYKTLYEWCIRESVPAYRGSNNEGEDTYMVIGPYWSEKIDELIHRSAMDRDIRGAS